MKRLLLTLCAVLAFSVPVFAQEMDHPMFKPDDRVVFDLAAEDWVTAKTAHVTATVEAAVTAATAGSMRSDMTKAVGDLAKGDWRLTSFDRDEDQTGMEHWSATFEARLPEAELGGINEAAKKLSKAGMQISVSDIDFSPTLDEMETARAALRMQIYKSAAEQLTALNTAMPGKNYRIALVNFTGDEGGMAPMPHVTRGRPGNVMMMNAAAPAPSEAPQPQPSQKVTISARIVLASAPDKTGK